MSGEIVGRNLVELNSVDSGRQKRLGLGEGFHLDDEFALTGPRLGRRTLPTRSSNVGKNAAW